MTLSRPHDPFSGHVPPAAASQAQSDPESQKTAQRQNQPPRTRRRAPARKPRRAAPMRKT